MPLPEEELLQVISEHAANKKDIVFFHTADASTYRGVLNIFCNLTLMNKWKDLPRFHLCTPYDEQVMPYNDYGQRVRHAVRYMKLLGLLDKFVFLYAENELLAAHLANEWKVTVRSLPVPPEKSLLSKSKVHNNKKLHVMYLGDARAEKGFNLLPKLVKKVLGSAISQKVKFTLQASPEIAGYTPDIKSSIEALKSMESEALTIIPQAQSVERYLQLLNSADAVLLCYDQGKYRVRGSGIAVEAVTHAVTIISTPGTFPSYIAGEAGVNASNADGIFKALEEICENRQAYVELALARRDWYFNKFSGNKYHNILRSAGISQENAEEVRESKLKKPRNKFVKMNLELKSQKKVSDRGDK